MATPKKQAPRYLLITTLQKHFQRCGIRFERDLPRLINVASLETGQEERLRGESMLKVEDLTEQEAERYMLDAKQLVKTPADLRAALDAADAQVELLTEENDKLREENRQLLNDLSLTRAKAHAPAVGPGGLGPTS